jgi:hypothetical protein
MTRTRAIGKTTIAFVVTLTLAAWFLLSNHCALGVTAPVPNAVSDACPMHSAPAKKKPPGKTPCCKEVRAIVAKCVTAQTAAVRLITTRQFATDIFPELTQVVVENHGLDTGPPGSLSFAESVLQESMLAHAPPVS